MMVQADEFVGESSNSDDLNSTARKKSSLVHRFTQARTIQNLPSETFESKTPSVDRVSFLCGLGAGVVQAAVLTPYDRALYLSIAKKRPFISIDNFRNPFSGISQSIGGRALSSGLYFPLEQFFFRSFHPEDHHAHSGCQLRNFAAGTAAGAVNAMVINPLSAVKYKTWSRVTYNRGMVKEAISMLQQGGTGVFYKGLASTLCRDISFGGCYTFLRLQAQYTYELPPEHQWTANLCAAALATIVSGPFNLARNVQYHSKSSESAPSTWTVLEELVAETRQKTGGTHERVAYLTRRLRIGWGTARVATGMAFGHWIYDGLHELAHHNNTSD